MPFTDIEDLKAQLRIQKRVRLALSGKPATAMSENINVVIDDITEPNALGYRSFKYHFE